MAGWAGFSDRDLQRLKEVNDQEERNRNVKAGMVMKAGSLQKGKAPTVEKLLKVQRGPHAAPSSTVSPSQRLYQPKPTSHPIPNHGGNKIPRERIQKVNNISVSESDITSSDMKADDSGLEMFMIKEEADPVEIDAKEALSRDMENLDKFRESQKHMEEANKQRKALLAKTLNERQRKAREEAEKLSHIQKELHKLDNLLSADVTVIRSRIEIASRDFLDAQKRYDRAEREFVEAKIELQQTSELKEQLTEHLYTIIHQNEVRKSRKLAELMKELEMEASEDCVQLPDLPPLASFNTINVVHSPKSPTSPDKSKSVENVPVDASKDKIDNFKDKEDSVNESNKGNPATSNKNVSENIDSSNSKTKSISDNSENEEINSSKPGDLINFSPSKSVTNSPKVMDSNETSECHVEIQRTSSPKETGEKPSSPQETEKEIPQGQNDKESLSVHTESQDNSSEHTATNSVTSNNLDTVRIQESTQLSTESPQRSTQSSQRSTESPQSSTQTTTEMPSSWTLNLINIKKEPDT